MIKISNIPKGYLLLEDGDEIRADDLCSYEKDIKDLSTNLAYWQTRNHTGTWRTGWLYTIRKAPPVKKQKLNKKQLAALKELELFIRHNGVKCYVLERLERFKETLGIEGYPS